MRGTTTPVAAAGWWVGLGAAALALVGCGDDVPTAAGDPADDFSPGVTCTVPPTQIYSGGPGKDGIPALTDPPLVGPFDPAAEFLRPDDRVIGVEIDGEWLAVPHNVLWWHEIVNLEMGDARLAVTYCPLTGSSIAFDRASIGGAELGVSGLLYLNNLIMYDRSDQESLWPQMLGSAACGPQRGATLEPYPLVEMTWEGWRSLHPETRVITGSEFRRDDYVQYPYGSYEVIDNAGTLFPLPSPIDRRRPPKERLLGLPDGTGGLAFPFGELAVVGPLTAVESEHRGAPIVVLWSTHQQGAAAYSRVLDGDTLGFEVRSGRIVDTATESVWAVDGRATAGPHEGRSLTPVTPSYTAFWFAWAAFQPDTRIWSAPR